MVKKRQRVIDSWSPPFDYVFSRLTWNLMTWDGLVQPTGKYCSIHRMEYPEFQTGITWFGRMESAQFPSAQVWYISNKQEGTWPLFALFSELQRRETLCYVLLSSHLKRQGRYKYPAGYNNINTLSIRVSRCQEMAKTITSGYRILWTSRQPRFWPKQSKIVKPQHGILASLMHG